MQLAFFKKIEKKNIPDILFIFLFILLLVHAFISCIGSDVSGDEYFSYSTANNEQDFLYYTIGHIEESYENGWIPGEDINKTLTVADGEQFDILSTYRQARNNVHPPLFYMILHLSSALIPGEFSHWTGSILNLIYFAAVVIVLYKLSQLLFRNKYLALVCPLMWGFSCAAISLTGYIRMYLPLSLVCLLILYFHTKLLSDDNWNRVTLILLAGSVTIGALIHHYFYVFLGFSCVTYFTILLIKKCPWKKIITYCLTIGAGIVTELCLYPYTIKHIFFTYRGEETQANLANTDLAAYIENFKLFLIQINEKALNNLFFYICIIVVVLLLSGMIISLYIKKKGTNTLPSDTTSVFTENAKTAFIYILLSGILYTLVLSKVSYAMLWTYISPAYIPTIIATIMIIVWAVQKSFHKYNVVIAAIIIIAVSCLHIPQDVSANLTSYKRFESIEDALAPHYGNDVLFCYESSWDNIFYGRMSEMRYMDEIHVFDCAELSNTDLISICESRETKDPLLLYIPYRSELKESYVQTVSEKMNMNATLVYEYNKVVVYELNTNEKGE